MKGKELEEYLTVQNRAEDIRGEPRRWTIEKYCSLLIRWLSQFGYTVTGWDILDVGCREFFTEKQFPGANVVGIDINKHAKEYNPAVHTVDAHHMDEHFDAGHFDLVMCIHSLEHTHDIPLVVKNACTLLKPHGLLFITSPMPAVKGGCDFSDIPSTEYLVGVCEDVGFQGVDAFVTHDTFDLTGYATSVFALFKKVE